MHKQLCRVCFCIFSDIPHYSFGKDLDLGIFLAKQCEFLFSIFAICIGQSQRRTCSRRILRLMRKPTSKPYCKAYCNVLRISFSKVQILSYNDKRVLDPFVRISSSGILHSLCRNGEFFCNEFHAKV